MCIKFAPLKLLGFLMHNDGLIYGYACVSTDARDLSNKVVQRKAAGWCRHLPVRR